MRLTLLASLAALCVAVPVAYAANTALTHAAERIAPAPVRTYDALASVTVGNQTDEYLIDYGLTLGDCVGSIVQRPHYTSTVDHVTVRVSYECKLHR